MIKQYLKAAFLISLLFAFFGFMFWIESKQNEAANAEGRVIKLAVSSWRCSKFHMQTKFLGPDIAVCDEYQRVILPVY